MAPSQTPLLQCPICDFADDSERIISLHIEHLHFSPKGINDQISQFCELSLPVAEKDESENPYLPCPEPNCKEQVLWLSMQDHLDLHLAEQLDTTSSSSHSQASSDIENDEHDLADSGVERSGLERRSVSAGTPSGTASSTSPPLTSSSKRRQPRRLGCKELGPYAFEPRMPSHLHALLLAGGKKTTVQRISSIGTLYRTTHISNEISHIVPLLATLLHADATVEKAWLCHESVQYVTKLEGEGAFCGYRNLQMLFSYLVGVKWVGCEELRKRGIGGGGGQEGRVPGVLELQELIEEAWDRGFDAVAKEETGGIRGTRKYIGTPEAQSLLKSLDIPHDTRNFQDKLAIPEPSTGKCPHNAANAKAHDQLFTFVESYFQPSQRASKKISQTALPPLYLQQPGHSVTIVGFETRKNGQKNLLVLDPGFWPSDVIEKMLDARMAGAGRSGGGGGGSSSSGGEGNGRGRSSRGSSPGHREGKNRSGVGGDGTILTSRGLVRKRQVGQGGNGSTSTSTGGHSAVGSSTHAGGELSRHSSSASKHGAKDDKKDEKRLTVQRSRSPKLEHRHGHGHGRGQGRQASKLLDAYRRGKGKFAKFSEFEVVVLRMKGLG